MSSKHIVRNVQGKAKDFVSVFDQLCYARNRRDVFSDWVYMATASIHNVINHDDVFEAEYLNIAHKYKANELEKMSELLAIVVVALEENSRDFMGEIYQGAMLSNDHQGQFFTPYTVSQMMAGMQMNTDNLPKDRIITVSDPACGAGGMLVAAAMELRKADFNYQQWSYFEGQDIDPLCCRMCFLQLALLGIPAVIICGDTLRMELRWTIATPMYYLNMIGPRLARQRERQNDLENKSIQKELRGGDQLELFIATA